MVRVLLLTVTAVFSLSLGVFDSCCDALVFPFVSEWAHDAYEDIEHEPEPPATTPNHIMPVVLPSEIRVPTLNELNRFVATTAAASESSEENSAEIRATAKPLTYTALGELLARWQLANERNAYKTNPLELENVPYQELRSNGVNKPQY